MPAKKIKIAFYISCVVNTILTSVFLIINLITYEVKLMLVGAFIAAFLNFVLIGLGAWAVWKNKTTLQWLVFVSTVVFAVFSLVIAIVGTHDNVGGEWERQKKGKDSMHYMERALDCCGKNGPNDYPSNNMTIPKSCFPYGHEGNPEKVYKVGCEQRWKNFQSHPAQFIIMCVAQSAYATLLGLLTSHCINNDLRNVSSYNLPEVMYGARLG